MNFNAKIPYLKNFILTIFSRLARRDLAKFGEREREREKERKKISFLSLLKYLILF
jgi:hypothetical protein